MIIAGGVYVEVCVSPDSTALLGSAGRAALAIAGLSPHVSLHTFYPAIHAEDVFASFEPSGIEVHVYPASAEIQFKYLHPLSRPRIAPIPLPVAPNVDVVGDSVLRFGCLEGSFRTVSDLAIYDPQSGTSPTPFHANGSTASRLVQVLNVGELSALTGSADLGEGARKLLEETATAAVVVKAGAEGAYVFEGLGDPSHVPAFEAKAVYKIGSGDVFSGAFAHYWAEAKLGIVDAARMASLQTAGYVETRLLPLPKDPVKRPELARSSLSTRRVYLAGPFFTTAQRWLVEEARAGLLDLGLDVFSPYHDVGIGAAEHVAAKNLHALNGCDVVLALLADIDPGTLFEAGHARANGIPVIAYHEGLRSHDLTMLLGTGCVSETDFATAIYRTAWAELP